MATKSAKKGAETEINRLRAQVRELQAQLAGNDPDRESRAAEDSVDDSRPEKYRRVADDATNAATDLPVRLMDEASKFTRGLTFATLEQLRFAGNVLQEFADEVISRNQPDSSTSGKSADEGGKRRRTITGLATDLPADLSSGFLRALNRSLDMPGAAVDRFHESYRQTEEEAEPSLSRVRRTQSRTTSGTRRTSKASRLKTRRSTSPISAARQEEPAEESAPTT